MKITPDALLRQLQALQPVSSLGGQNTALGANTLPLPGPLPGAPAVLPTTTPAPTFTLPPSGPAPTLLATGVAAGLVLPPPASQTGPMGQTATVQPQGLTVAFADGQVLTFTNAPTLPPGTAVTLSRQPDGQWQWQVTQPASAQRDLMFTRLLEANPAWRQALTQAGPVPANVWQALPVLAAGLGPAVGRLLTALPTGEVNAWLPEDVQAWLQRSGGLAGLQQEFQQLQVLQHKPEAADAWRVLVFPYVQEVDDQQPKQGTLWWRTDADDQQRLVLTAQFSNLGMIQLDVWRHGQQLQVKVVGERPWPATVTAELNGLVQSVLQAAGWQGQLVTQTQPVILPLPSDYLTQDRHSVAVKV